MAVYSRGRDGEDGIEIVGRPRLTETEARRMVVREMLIMRSQGYTDSEIAVKYRYSRETVNRMINSAPDHIKERLREVRLV